MAKYSIEAIKAIASAYVTKAKISNATFSVTRDNTALLVDKIAKVFTIDTNYIDKLAMFDGETLPFGKTIEEYQQDLILPQDYDSTGADALAKYGATYRPAFYSFTLGRKFIPITIENNDIERAVNNVEQFVSIISMKSKRLYDSVNMWRYEIKREIVAKYLDLVNDEMTASTAWANSTNFSVGVCLKDTNSNRYIVVKEIKSTDALTLATAKSGGYIIKLDLNEVVAVPTDTTTSEAFIKSIKKAVEVASDLSEGNSLNGNTLGATDGLVLLVKQGVIPVVEVEAIAGAFNKEQMAVPAEIVVVKDFGSDTSNAYAVLLDRRGFRLHNTYKAVREQVNAKGDWLTLFYHSEDTAFVSRNTFIKVIKSA